MALDPMMLFKMGADLTGKIAGDALGGPLPSSTATGGNTTLGPNNVTYNKGPDWRMVGAGVLLVGLVWLWKRKK